MAQALKLCAGPDSSWLVTRISLRIMRCKFSLCSTFLYFPTDILNVDVPRFLRSLGLIWICYVCQWPKSGRSPGCYLPSEAAGPLTGGVHWEVLGHWEDAFGEN